MARSPGADGQIAWDRSASPMFVDRLTRVGRRESFRACGFVSDIGHWVGVIRALPPPDGVSLVVHQRGRVRSYGDLAAGDWPDRRALLSASCSHRRCPEAACHAGRTSRDHDDSSTRHHHRHRAYRLHSVQNCGRAAIALLQSRYRMDRTLADTYLSVAIDFNITQVVDLLKGVHPGSG